MELSEPERYKLLIGDDSLSFSVLAADGGSKFSTNATSRMPKIYVVSTNDTPIYVGVTTQPMRKRLQQGWRANGQRGYYGYEWRFNFTEADLDVWCHLNAAGNSAVDVETIEAEVVHLIRSTGQWPRFQTEIHFHLSGVCHRKAAREIMKRYDIASLEAMAPENWMLG